MKQCNVESSGLRIGCSPAYVFAHFGEDANYDNLIWSISRVKELGFSGLQLETYNERQIDIFSDKHIKTIKNLFNSLGIESSQFIGHSVKSLISSVNVEKRQEGIEKLKKLIEICEKLEIMQVFNLPSSPPPELILSYTETYPGAMQPVMSISDGFTWDFLWQGYIETITEALKLIEKAGMRLGIEAVPGGIIANTDSFLRLSDRIGSRNLGLIMDTGHLFVQKESLEIVIEKLGDRLFGTHICDNDGCIDYHWLPGKGKIKWKGVLRTLKKIGYEGFLDIEINQTNDPDAVYLEGKEYLEKLLKELNGG